MDIIINSDSSLIPERSTPLISEGSAALNMLQCLGSDPYHPPLAEVLRQEQSLSGQWCIISPIHWEATHNDAMIQACNHELKLDENDSKIAYQFYADYLAAEGISLHYYNKEIWLLDLKDKPKFCAKAVHKLLHQSLMPELIQLDSSMYWQRFFTESQMFFAQLATQSCINGIWMWGEAPLFAKKNRAICADDSLIALARTCSNNVTRYHPSVSIKDYSMVLISHVETLSKSHHDLLKKAVVRWYWNNSAYSINDCNWFTRLWRTLTHAD